MTEMLILDKVVNEMPMFVNDDLAEFKVKFEFGTKQDLNSFLTSANKDTDNNVYPLIYCQTPYNAVDDFILDLTKATLTIVIAVNNDNLDMSNKERTKITVTKILDKVYKMFLTAIEESTEVSANLQEIRRTIFYGFEITNNDFEQSNDVNANWDAVKFNLIAEFNNKIEC